MWAILTDINQSPEAFKLQDTRIDLSNKAESLNPVKKKIEKEPVDFAVIRQELLTCTVTSRVTQIALEMVDPEAASIYNKL